MNNENLITSIKNMCKNNNITITKLEDELGMSQGLISRWAKSSPSLDKIVDIADYFHVSLDEVVGYNQYTNDDFLNILYKKTSDKSIQWQSSKTINKDEEKVKEYSDNMPFNTLQDNIHELNYAIQFNNGYIVMYSRHVFDQILHPKELILFIQPSDDSYLVDQHYSTDELMKLWVKLLNSLDDEAPDEVKAENLKNDFISDFAKSTPYELFTYMSKWSDDMSKMIQNQDNLSKNITKELLKSEFPIKNSNGSSVISHNDKKPKNKRATT